MSKQTIFLLLKYLYNWLFYAIWCEKASFYRPWYPWLCLQIHPLGTNIKVIETLKKIHQHFLIITCITILHNIFTLKTNICGNFCYLFLRHRYGTVLHLTGNTSFLLTGKYGTIRYGTVVIFIPFWLHVNIFISIIILVTTIFFCNVLYIISSILFYTSVHMSLNTVMTVGWFCICLFAQY